MARRIEPLALGPEARQAALDVAREQRARNPAVPEPLGEDRVWGIQPGDVPAPEELPAVSWIDHRPASGGDHPRDPGLGIRGLEPRDHVAIERPEGDLAIGLEDPGDRPARAPLDLAVGVDELG